MKKLLDLGKFFAIKTGEFTYEIYEKDGTKFNIGEHLEAEFAAGKLQKKE